MSKYKEGNQNFRRVEWMIFSNIFTHALTLGMKLGMGDHMHDDYLVRTSSHQLKVRGTVSSGRLIRIKNC